MQQITTIPDEWWMPVPFGGCWIWMRALSGDGYGQIYSEGRVCYAHRISYELKHGVKLHSKIEVCHSCDVRPCINPDHLWLGSHRANILDAAKKGRMIVKNRSRGENRPAAKLTEDAVRHIKNCNDPITKLAKLYGVDHTLISMVRRGKIWRHVL